MPQDSTGSKDRKQVKQTAKTATPPANAGGKCKQQITIGLDSGDKTSCYCALGEEGAVLFERSAATTKKGMAEMFGALARCRIALEVGTHSPWVSRLLKSFGHEVVVANARQVKLITQSSRKNDKLDAQTLARLARVNPQLLRPIEHRSEEAQQDLMAIRVRAGLVDARTMLVNSARGLAKAVGERLPKCAADNLGLERARRRCRELLYCLAARIRALCAFVGIKSLRAFPWTVTLSIVALSGATQPAPQSAVPALASNIPSTADRFTVLLVGAPAGQQASWTTADGMLHIFYQYNDRGRGPATISLLRLDRSGVPTSESVTGNDYLKTPVHENYTLASGSARWHNEYEEGSRTLAAPAVYVPMNLSPEETGLLAAAALHHGGRLALLPEGEAQVARKTSLTLESSGQTRQITLYAIQGLDFSPSYVWLDEREAFFATVDDWLSVVPQSWQSSLAALRAAQDRVIESRSAELARTLIHRPAGPVAITHVDLFDAPSAAIVHDQTVVFAGNRIRSVGRASAAVIPAGAQIIDGRGKTLLPGLWDMHAHVADNDGLLNLAAGVTTVRDLANDIDSLLARRRRIEHREEVGTRIVLAGVIDGPGPYHAPTKVLVATEDQARAAVDNYKRLGYVQIKIYSSVPPAVVPAIIQEAHRLGMRVSGHIPAEMYADQCVDIGYNEIQHANFLMLNFMRDVRDTNTRSRLTEVAKRGAGVDLHSPAMQSFVQLLLGHHIDLDPTLDAFEDMYFQGPGQIPPAFQPVADRLPPQVRRQLLSSGLAAPPGMQATYRRSFENMLAMVGMMYRAGIPIEDGTDEMAGFSLHRELELNVEAGLPANRVLQDATLNAARIMSMDRDLGSIAPGKFADLDLIDGDPVADIANVRKTFLTVKDGDLYHPAELEAALGIAPRALLRNTRKTVADLSPPPEDAGSYFYIRALCASAEGSGAKHSCVAYGF